MFGKVKAVILTLNALLAITVLLSSSGCSDRRLAASLDFAGDNRASLQAALDSFAENPEQLAAARFIVRNLPHWYCYDDARLDSIESLLGVVGNNEDIWYFRDISGRDWQSFNYTQLPKVYDSHTITAQYLIENIEAAYGLWKNKRWNFHLSQSDFNELLLPYRIGDEPISEWRSLYASYYGTLLDSLYAEGDDVLVAAQILANELQRQGFKYNVCASWPHRRAADLFLNRAGPCRDQCDRAVYALRSCGIPCAIDCYFASPETPTSHQWVVVRDNLSGRFIPLSDNMIAHRDSSINDWRKKGKVYRYCAGLQEDRADVVKSIASQCVIKDYFIKDVTAEYFGHNSATVEIANPGNLPAFLGVFAPSGWRVIDMAVSHNERQATFSDVEPGVIYMPLTLSEAGRPKPCGYPFLFGRDCSVKPLIPEDSSQDLTLTRKMPFMPWLIDWFSEGIIGSRFELSTDSLFRHAVKSDMLADTIHTNFVPFYFPPTFTSYVRFTVAEGDDMLVGEIEVYQDSVCRHKIPCRVLAETDQYHHPENAADGDILSFFSAPKGCRSIVLQLDQPAVVSAVGLVPRNNDNFIWPGDTYELLYFAGPRIGWKSVGVQTAAERSLTFTAPRGALYWLRDLSKGNEEEVFIYEDGEQKFVHDL